MNKVLFFMCVCFIFSNKLISQNSRVLISGMVLDVDIPIENVHIINLNSNKGSLSGKNGKFKISVKENDSLLFTNIQFEKKLLIISSVHIANQSIFLNLKQKINVLDEVELKERENIASSLGLPNSDKTPLNKLERKFNYYSQKSAPMVILDALLLGPILNNIPFVKPRNGGIEDIYYLVSGERKKDRKLKKLIDKDKMNMMNHEYVFSIRNHFKDDFFIYTLKINIDKIDSFIYYCFPRNIIPLYNKKRYLGMIDVFLEESKKFNLE